MRKHHYEFVILNNTNILSKNVAMAQDIPPPNFIGVISILAFSFRVAERRSTASSE